MLLAVNFLISGKDLQLLHEIFQLKYLFFKCKNMPLILFLIDEVKILENKVMMVPLEDRMTKLEDQVWIYDLILCISTIKKILYKINSTNIENFRNLTMKRMSYITHVER